MRIRSISPKLIAIEVPLYCQLCQCSGAALQEQPLHKHGHKLRRPLTGVKSSQLILIVVPLY